jgi:hypothetical protein
MNNRTYHWSRAPGRFVNKFTGKDAFLGGAKLSTGPQFSGTVREWYETLPEVIEDLAAVMEKETGVKPQFLETTAEINTILQYTSAYNPASASTDRLIIPNRNARGLYGGMVKGLEVYYNQDISNVIVMVGCDGDRREEYYLKVFDLALLKFDSDGKPTEVLD